MVVEWMDAHIIPLKENVNRRDGLSNIAVLPTVESRAYNFKEIPEM